MVSKSKTRKSLMTVRLGLKIDEDCDVQSGLRHARDVRVSGDLGLRGTVVAHPHDAHTEHTVPKIVGRIRIEADARKEDRVG